LPVTNVAVAADPEADSIRAAREDAGINDPTAKVAVRLRHRQRAY
jgi:hypothetical protein